MIFEFECHNFVDVFCTTKVLNDIYNNIQLFDSLFKATHLGFQYILPPF